MIKKLFGENAKAFTFIAIGLAVVAFGLVTISKRESECSDKGGSLVRNAFVGFSCVQSR